MGCGCKKKPGDEPQAPQTGQATPATTPTPAQNQEQVIKISTILREMVENKKL
jgi:hypothetical protein